MIVFATTKCIRHPGRKATVWTGHVRKIVARVPVSVAAGWCSVACSNQDIDAPRLLNRIGCYGGWTAEYGIKKEVL